MKRYLFLILILLIASPCFSASYYGCNASQAINSDSLWCAADQVAGSDCTKDSGDFVAAATVLQAGNTLYANGCTITIPTGTFTATKISTKGDGAEGEGGGFTATANGITVTLDASVEGGTTDCLTIGSGTNAVTFNLLTTSGGGTIVGGDSANADGVVVAGSAVTLTIGKSGSPVAITGGGISTGHGVNDGHTTTSGTVYANSTGGSAGKGYTLTSTGGMTYTGNATGGGATGAYGLQAGGTGTVAMTGNCIGSSTSLYAAGCYSSSGLITVTGSLIWGDGTSSSAPPMFGNVSWNPVAAGSGVGSYVHVPVGTDVYAGTQDTAGNLIPTKYFINKTDGVSTQGTASTGGGGAWAN